MTSNPQPPASDRLHPAVYGVIVGLACLFALGAWGFASGGYTDVVLVVVTGLITVAVGIPFLLSRVGRRDGDRHHAPLREWMGGEFETSYDRMKSTQATVEILLPIAAVAIGITLFALEIHLVPHTLA